MLALAALTVVALLVIPTAGAKTPQQLKAALLAARYTGLPTGFSNPKVTFEKPSRKGSIGAVAVEVSGPDASNAALFSIYQTRAAALAAIKSPKPTEDVKVVGRAPGWGKQSVMMMGSVTGENWFGKKVTTGVTLLAVLRGNVIVQSYSASLTNEDSGDVLSARKLLAWAVKQLDRVST